MKCTSETLVASEMYYARRDPMKAAVRVTPRASANAEKQLNSFIDKFDPRTRP